MGKLLLPIANINGGSGETAATIRANRYPSAKSSSAKILGLLAGVNAGTSLAQDIADVTYMAQDFAASASDRVVFVYDEMPVDTGAGWTAGQKSRHASLRDSIRQLHRPSKGVYVVPSWRICTGGNDSDTPLAGFFISDGVHPAIMGAFLLGQWLNQNYLATAVPAYDPYSGAVFAVGSALDGANFAGVTGNAISTASLSGANVASSRMVVDGSTTWAELTLNTATAPSLNKSSATLPANVIPGTSTISSILKVKLHAGVTNIRSLQLGQIKQSAIAAGTNAGFDMQHQGTGFEIGEIPADVDTVFLLHTPPVLVAADATSVRWQLSIVPEIVSTVTQTIVGLVSCAFAGIIVES